MPRRSRSHESVSALVGIRPSGATPIAAMGTTKLFSSYVRKRPTSNMLPDGKTGIDQRSRCQGGGEAMTDQIPARNPALPGCSNKHCVAGPDALHYSEVALGRLLGAKVIA